MKNSKDVVEARQRRLLAYMKAVSRASVTELAKQFDTTTATIRRDLTMLEEQGHIQRNFGGAVCLQSDQKTVPVEKTAQRVSFKHYEIARAAAGLLSEHDTVFMNSSSTALMTLQYINDRHIVVITNNSTTPFTHVTSNIELILTGGLLYMPKKSLVGEAALDTLSKITASKCILGVSGISAQDGITSTVQQETAINHMMLSRCNGKRIIVADSSKVGIRHNFFSGTVSDIDILVTDSGADPLQIARLRQAGVEVIMADHKAEYAGSTATHIMK